MDKTWNNATKWNRAIEKAMVAYQGSVDVEKQRYADACKRAELFNQTQELNLRSEAGQEYAQAVDSLKREARAALEAVFEGVRADIAQAAKKAPSEEQTRFLEALKMRDKFGDASEIEAAMEAVRGNMAAVMAFVSIVSEKSVSVGDMTVSASAGIEVYTPAKADKAMSFYFDWLKDMINIYPRDRRAGEIRAYYSPSFYSSNWTPLCYFLELCGA